MKKFIYFLTAFVLGISLLSAKPVTPVMALKVAGNFYNSNSGITVRKISLVYTAKSISGNSLYYVFNINDKDGFVIISADDAAQPVIGYDTENNFSIPDSKSNIAIWLKKRGEEITAIQEKNLPADGKISQKWARYLSNEMSRQSGNLSMAVAPIVQSKWNQSPFYNSMCPGGSVTGCVATAMAQIMRYWSYPLHGASSSSYNSIYGLLSADYSSATYNWSSMSLNLATANNDVALINFHCGVSVEMDYSPSGSGAWVVSGDNPVCAQNSYVNYFGYDPSTIQGLYRSSYDDTSWIAILKSDIDIGRPIQYAGWDPSAGGHTWVCDGYDQNNFFHMNWGWGGSSNGYFDINNLNPGYNFSDGHEAVTGIVPMSTTAVDAAIPAVSSPLGYYCSSNFNPSLKLQNFGNSTLTSCVINYKLDNNTIQTMNWNGSLVYGQYTMVSLASFTVAPGTHTLVCYSSNPNGTSDENASNDQSVNTFNVTLGTTSPLAEGFEVSMLPSSDWKITHTTGADWSVTGTASATGIKSAMIDNSLNIAGNVSHLQNTFSYDLASYSNPALTFKMAYQQKTSSTSEKLQVYVSTDCGASWLSKWARWGSTLPTVPGTAGTFVPMPSQFTTYTVNINSLFTAQKVLFRWTFYADPNAPGNNIYIDDINLFDAATTSGIQNVETKMDLNIYPNPSSGEINVSCSLSEKSTVSIVVTDVLGRHTETVDPKTYSQGDLKIALGAVKPYDKGIYFVNIYVDGKKISRKVIVQ